MQHNFIRHIPKKSESYLIGTPRAEDYEPWWKSFRLGFYHNRDAGNGEAKRLGEYAIEWSAMRRGRTGKRRSGFGLGLAVQRADGDDDLEISLYLGWLLSVWFHLSNPWLQRVTAISKEKDPKHYWDGREYSAKLFPYPGQPFAIRWGQCVNGGGKDYPGWEFSGTSLARKLFGYVKSEKVILEQGENIVIPMPEGVYLGNWERVTYTQNYTKRLGQLYRKVRPYRRSESWSIDIPGGIPHEGKGENSWDCGMDGTFGLSCGASSLEDAIGTLVGSVLRDRARYGGPHNLPMAMSVKQAEEWQRDISKGVER